MRKVLNILMVVLFAVSVVSAQDAEMDNDTKKLYNEGIQLMKSGQYQKAVDAFNDALKNSNDYRIYQQKGTALQKAAKNANSANRDKILQQSIDAFKGTFQTKPDYDLAHFKIAASYFQMEQYEQAIAEFEKTIAITNNNKVKQYATKNMELAKEKLAYPKLVEANTALSNKRFQEAINSFIEVLQISNSDAAYLGLADAYSEMAEWEKALEAAKNAVAYTSDIPRGAPYYFMGLAFNRMGNVERAVENYQKCIDDKSSKNKGYRDRAQHDLEKLQG